MCEANYLERLEKAPISELSFDDVRLKRSIQKAGFCYLPDLLSLTDKEIDARFDGKYADSIIKMRKKYRAAPDAFAASMLQPKIVEKAATLGAPLKVRHSREPKAEATSSIEQYEYELSRSSPARSHGLFSAELEKYEERARDAFDDLDSRSENVMVYQVFEEFSTDLDELSAAFEKLIKFYPTNPRFVLMLIDKYLPNAFMVYVADKARRVFNDHNLWGNFFASLGIFDSNVQGLLKHIFIKHVEERGMPLYCRDEEVNHYYYTALLHGGLSEDSWSNLWEKLLPLAQEVSQGRLGFGGEMDGRSVLRELKNPESRYAPEKAVLNILEKAPDSTIAPLFEASMRVAAQIVDSNRVGSRYTMLSSFGLPEAAMQALRDNQERVPSSAIGGRTAAETHGRRSGAHRVVYLPNASLQLDLSEGVVTMRWPRQRFPLRFAGDKIDYYVDGELKASSEFDMSVGKCILNAVGIAVNPRARYDVELKLMHKDEQTGDYIELSSLSQSFRRNKPGCFEFVKDGKGFYRLRGKSERLTKKRRIAYIVKEGYKIVPGQGMKAVSEHEASGDWDENQIFIYDVEPGSAGSVVNELTGEEVAVWQERYVAKIDKHRIIGETSDGVDLYGRIPNELDTNDGLPSVSIEALDGAGALKDLDIMCCCDGELVSMPRCALYEENAENSGIARIEFNPSNTSLFSWHIEECVIEARQKSSGGKVVFRYRFAVVPIQEFKPLSISIDHGCAVAKYGFQACLPIDVVRVREEADVAGECDSPDSLNAWERYEAKALLKDEFLRVRIRSRGSGKETDAKLALAAIDFDMPKRLANLSEERPICLADALELGPSAANFKIVSYGWRYNRAVLVLLGSKPLFFKNLKQPGEYGFNLFRHASLLQQDDDKAPTGLPLKLSLCYGDDVSTGEPKPAWTDVQMLDCVEGLGISGWKVLPGDSLGHVLRFEGKPLCDIHFRFFGISRYKERGDKPIATAFVGKGSAEVALPSSVVRQLGIKREVAVEMSPSDSFGDPQREYATSITLK